MLTSTLIIAATCLGITAILCLAAMRAWRGWLDLRRLEIASRSARPEASEAAEDGVGVRIELADVRERLKKLEAIASGVEL